MGERTSQPQGGIRDDGDLRTELLTEARVAQSFALARFCNPALTIEEWEAVGLGPADIRGAILLVCSRNYVRALCRYVSDSDLRHGSVLVVTDVATGHPLDPARYAPQLMRGAEDRARALGCNAVLVRVPNAAAWLEPVLEGLGHRPDGRVFSKPLTPGPFFAVPHCC